jgi:hypothetical protein
MNSSYAGDYFYYSPEMAAKTRRIEAVTNPVFAQGSMAGVACLRNFGNFGGLAHGQKEKRELPEGKISKGAIR